MLVAIIVVEALFGAPLHYVVRQTLDRHWTENPIFVQSLSNLCQGSVHIQGMSIACPIEVQCLSRTCPNTSVWTGIGHGNQGFVQTLSNTILTSYEIHKVGQILDKPRMWTNFGHELHFHPSELMS